MESNYNTRAPWWRQGIQI